MSKPRTRALVLAAILAAAQASAIPHYFKRDEVCGGSPRDSLTQCDNDLDDGLCCTEGTTCISLAGGSTVLCCRPGDGCTRMKPITCNINAQNPEVNPAGILKTTALNAQLPRCGGNCCPFGFSCNDEGECDMDDDQSQRPRELPNSERPSTSNLPSSIPAPTILPSTTNSESTTSPTSSNSPPAEEQQEDDDDDDNTLPTAIIVVAVLGSLLVVVALSVGVVMFLARRKRKAGTPPQNHPEKRPPGLGVLRASTSTSSFGNLISEPIPHQDSAMRCDFILKTPDSSASDRRGSLGGTTAASTYYSPGSARNPPPRVPARTLSNATMTTASHAHLAIPPIRTMRNQQKPHISSGSAWTRHAAAARAAVPDAATPVTPRLQREPSSESINVFADPGTVGSSGGLQPPRPRRLTSGTTFTDLMEEAQLGDVRRGNPFVPRTPGAVSCRAGSGGCVITLFFVRGGGPWGPWVQRAGGLWCISRTLRSLGEYRKRQVGSGRTCRSFIPKLP